MKPDDVTQEAWEASVSLRDGIPSGQEPFTTTVEDVARAIMAATKAENEAILEMVEADIYSDAELENASNSEYWMSRQAEFIRDAIRKRTEAGNG